MAEIAGGCVRRVVLAESDACQRSALAAVLRAAELEVVEVASGFGAFRSFVEFRGEVDLVIAPYAMREYDGPALARGLATLAPDLPVMLVGGENEGSAGQAGNVRCVAGQAGEAELLRRAQLALAG